MEEDLRPENIEERDENGKPIKFKQSQFVCTFIFDNNKKCVVRFKHLREAMELINKNEDHKYPYGLGRKMPFYAWIYPMYKKILIENGFIANINDLNFSNKQKERLKNEDKKY